MISVLLADDHDVVRQGIRRLLERTTSVEICAEAQNGNEAVSLALQFKPDVVVLDLSMPEGDGLDVTRQIRQALPDTEVLILTMHRTDQLVRELVAAGARGYVLKSDPADDIVSAVEALGNHIPFFTTAPTEAILHGVVTGETVGTDGRSQKSALTSREREVVQLLTLGGSNKEVALTLGISVKTVETHRAAVMRKLGISSVVELVHYAIRSRIIEA